MAEDKKKPVAKTNQGGSKVKPSKMAYNNEKRDLKNKAKKADRHKRTMAKQAKRSAKRKAEGYVLPSYVNRLERRAAKRKKGASKAETEAKTTIEVTPA